MSVECGKARLAVRGPLEDADAASRTLSKACTHQAPHQSANPRRRRPTSVPHTTTEKDHPSPRRSRAQSAPRRDQRASHRPRTRAATAPRAPSARTASRPRNRRAAAEQSRFGPRAAPAGVRHAGRPAGPRAVCGVCGGRADPGTQSAPPGARPGRRASAPQVARLGVEKRLLRGAAGRAQRRAAPGPAPAGPAPGPRGGGGFAAAGGAHGGVLGVSGPPGRAAR